MERDRKWVEEKVGGEVDLLMEPGENRFRSLRWDLNDLDPQDISCGNWGIWAFRGKRLVFYLMSYASITIRNILTCIADMKLHAKILNKTLSPVIQVHGNQALASIEIMFLNSLTIDGIALYPEYMRHNITQELE